MNVQKIGPEYARTLGRLEAEVYPPDFCLGWRDFKEDLEEAESCGENYSFGLFHEGRLVGYIVAYVEDGDIFVSDLAILPDYRVGLRRLFVKFLQEVSKTKLNIVAGCRESSWKVCKDHSAFYAAFGYQLADVEATRYAGEPSWEIKFQYIG